MLESRTPLRARELWFSGKDFAGLKAQDTTATVRVGDRTMTTRDPKGGYAEGQFVTLRVRNGDATFEQWSATVAIRTGIRLTIGELTDVDLEGAPEGQRTKTELLRHLEAVYDRPLGAETIVTILRFEYKDRLKSIADLLRVGVFTIAREPRENPQGLDRTAYTVPLIAHDYPAKTPVMWNRAYEAFGLPYGNVMMVGDPDDSAHILDVLSRDPQYLGGGAGVGFKDEAITALDLVDEQARAIGAVNFIYKDREGKLHGVNTDGLGYAMSVEDVLRARGEGLHGKRVVILGAGGSANAIAFALAERGAQITVLNRTVVKAAALADRLNGYFQKSDHDRVVAGGEDVIAAAVSTADIVVNCSTKGAAGELEAFLPLARAMLPATGENVRANKEEALRILATIPRHALVSDIVLRKGQTQFLEASRTAGYTILDGIPMVVRQGIEAFWILHGPELEQRGITKERVADVMDRASRE